MNLTNRIENQDLASNDSNLSLIIFPICSGTVAILAIAALTKVLKNLNEVIKNILLVLSIHNLASAIVATLIMIFWDDGYDILGKCSALQILGGSNALINIGNLALISFTKYYLAWKTAKLEAPNLLIIISLTVLLYFGGYFFAVVMTLTTLSPLMSSCTGNEYEDRVNRWASVVGLIFAITSVVIGLVYDYSLYSFLKMKNQTERGVGQSEMIPWKTSNDRPYKYTVPIGASVIALITGIISCCGATLVSVFLVKPDYLAFGWAYLLPAVLLAVMIGLTIRTAWNQKPAPKLPKGPCFHGDLPNDKDEEEDQENAGLEHAEDGAAPQQDVEEGQGGPIYCQEESENVQEEQSSEQEEMEQKSEDFEDDPKDELVESEEGEKAGIEMPNIRTIKVRPWKEDNLANANEEEEVDPPNDNGSSQIDESTPKRFKMTALSGYQCVGNDVKKNEAHGQNDEHGIEMKILESDQQDLEIQKAQIALDQLDHDEDEVKTKQEVRKKPDKMLFAAGKSMAINGLPDIQID